jgi:hypothetical protein
MTHPPRGTGDEGTPGPWAPPAWAPPPADNEPPPQYAWSPGPGGPPPYWPQTAVRTDPLAVAALILGLAALVTCGVTGLVGAILGIVALARISGTRNEGRGMAVAGVTLSAVSIVGYLALFIYLGATFEETEGSGAGSPAATATATATPVYVDDLRPGDCVNGTDEAELTTVDVVPCADPHEGEVYAVFDLAGRTWPGVDTANQQASAGCESRQESYVDPAELDIGVDFYFVVPSEETWTEEDDRLVVCWFESTGDPLTGSVRDG